MIKNITLGQYMPGKSMIHRADPRTKIVLIILWMVLIFMADNAFDFIIYGAFLLLILISTHIPVRYTLKGLRPILIILVFTAVINIFTIPGERILVDFGFAQITLEGVIVAVKLTVRLAMLVVMASLLTLTTTPMALTDGLEKLMKPLNRIHVPVHEIAMMMSIALRFIPTLLDETDRIMKAQASRGADFDTGNIIQKAKSFIPVLVPLFVSAFKRAEELADAMESRCYRGSNGRTRMKQFRMSKVDVYICIISAFFLLFFFCRRSLL